MPERRLRVSGHAGAAVPWPPRVTRHSAVSRRPSGPVLRARDASGAGTSLSWTPLAQGETSLRAADAPAIALVGRAPAPRPGGRRGSQHAKGTAGSQAGCCTPVLSPRHLHAEPTASSLPGRCPLLTHDTW